MTLPPGGYLIAVSLGDGCPDCICDEGLLNVCSSDAAIDRTHCKMPAAGHVGQCKTGQIGARSLSLSKPVTVIMRVFDNSDNIVFESSPITIGPGRRVRARFDHCYTADEIGKGLWRWDVWPVDCADVSSWNNVYLRRVIVRP